MVASSPTKMDTKWPSKSICQKHTVEKLLNAMFVEKMSPMNRLLLLVSTIAKKMKVIIILNVPAKKKFTESKFSKLLINHKDGTRRSK